MLLLHLFVVYIIIHISTATINKRQTNIDPPLIDETQHLQNSTPPVIDPLQVTFNPINNTQSTTLPPPVITLLAVIHLQPATLSQPVVNPQTETLPQPFINPQLVTLPQPVINLLPAILPRLLINPQTERLPQPIINPQPSTLPPPVITPQPVTLPPPVINPQPVTLVPLINLQPVTLPPLVFTPQSETLPQPVINPQAATLPPPVSNSQPATLPPPVINPQPATLPPPVITPQTETLSPVINSQTETLPSPVINSQPETLPLLLVNPQTATMPPSLINLQTTTLPPPVINRNSETLPPPVINPQPATMPLPVLNPQIETLPPVINPQKETLSPSVINPQTETLPPPVINPQQPTLSQPVFTPHTETTPEPVINLQTETLLSVINPQAETLPSSVINPQTETLPPVINPQKETLPSPVVNPHLSTLPSSVTNPQPAGTVALQLNHTNNVDTGDCKCVPYYLCGSNETIVEDDYGMIDINDGFSMPCEHYLEICCNEVDVKQKESITRRPVLKKSQCGQRNFDGVDFQITGAQDNEANFGEFPWMVAILQKELLLDGASEVDEYQCGGSLIHWQVVLTAAHCVSRIDPKKLKVRAGEWDTQTTNEKYPYQHRDIKEVIIHENFYAGGLQNDIALLILENPFDEDEHINIICLPDEGEVVDGRECAASGWGKDIFGTKGIYQAIMKKVELPIVPRSQCLEELRKTRLSQYFKLHESFICAGGVLGKDTCKGDGGSPLVCPNRDNPKIYKQAGIVAWGIGCGTTTPGVYVNVPLFRGWIHSKLNTYNIVV